MKCTFPGCEREAIQTIKREGLELPVCREHGPINVSELAREAAKRLFPYYQSPASILQREMSEQVIQSALSKIVAEKDAEIERLTRGSDALVRQLGEFAIALKQSSGSAAIQITELTAELATLRATREQDHGAAIEAAAYDCSVEIERPLLWAVEIIARHMRTLITTITKQ